MKNADAALLELGRELKKTDYAFVTVTPESHRRVMAREGDPGEARTLRDVFGWNRRFSAAAVGPHILDLLHQAAAVDQTGGLYTSRVRYSTYRDFIFVHSGYPTIATDSVFFGPDTYRFIAALERCLAETYPGRAIDIGAGSGAGGIVLARRCPEAEIVLSDISGQALRYARINAELNAVPNAVTHQSDVLADVAGKFDLVISNPPYLVDPKARLYRDGGGALGSDLSLRILREAIERLAPGGRLLLYTGSAIVDGVDLFAVAAERELCQTALAYTYAEADPDVFGEELERADYSKADRIAAVTLTVAAP
jgi:methylase of polypeptide subunit release factors